MHSWLKQVWELGSLSSSSPPSSPPEIVSTVDGIAAADDDGSASSPTAGVMLLADDDAKMPLGSAAAGAELGVNGTAALDVSFHSPSTTHLQSPRQSPASTPRAEVSIGPAVILTSDDGGIDGTDSVHGDSSSTLVPLCCAPLPPL